MKLKISKRLRISLVGISIILAILLSYYTYEIGNRQMFEKRTEAIYTYNNKASIDYNILLKPNDIYDKNSLDSGTLFISQFIDYINTGFRYIFEGPDAKLRGTYSIGAKIKGLTYRGAEVITVWEKDFPLVENSRFYAVNEDVLIEEDIKLNFSEYNDFAIAVVTDTKINFDVVLTLFLDVNLNGSTDKGDFEEHLTPNIIIPLNTAMFEISGTPTIEKSGAIERTVEVQLPVDKNKVIFFGSLLGISTLALILLIFFTETAPKKEALERELNRIFKKHGDRLVALNNQMDMSNCKVVRTMEDLVRFADEVNRPILYRYDVDFRGITKFFVESSGDVYVFNLEDLIPKEEIEEAQEITSGEESKF